MSSSEEITQILSRVEAGDKDAVACLVSDVYDELRRLAAACLATERANHTLQPTALVHEAYLKLVDQTRVQWKGRAHFIALAASQMRRVLVDHARGRNRQKRGGGQARESVGETLIAVDSRSIDVISLDEALEEMSQFDAQRSQMIELRFFGGLSHREIGEVLRISMRDVDQVWRLARAWLRRRLGGETCDREDGE